MKKSGNDNYLVRSVDNALNLLDQFNSDTAEHSLTEMSKRLSLPKNNVFRLLATLESRNYLQRNEETDKYRLGSKTVELSQHVARMMGRTDIVSKVLKQLGQKSDEAIMFSVLKNNYIVNVDVVECNQPLRVMPRIGVPMPAYCTAAGKVHIAQFSDKIINLNFSSEVLKPHTPNTITNIIDFKWNLYKVVCDGYALEQEELEIGVVSIAAPVRDYNGNIIGAVSCSGPSSRFTINRIESDLVPLVKKGASDISAMFGYTRISG